MSTTAAQGELRTPLRSPVDFMLGRGQRVEQGRMAYLVAGYLTSGPGAAGGLFAGIAADAVDNSAGEDGSRTAIVLSEGDVVVETSGARQAWVGHTLRGIDSRRVDLAAGRGPVAGVCIRVLSPSRVVMRLAALRSAAA
ncbi:MAG: hypothetical protein AB7U73_05095 [Pirellulales bacterium]